MYLSYVVYSGGIISQRKSTLETEGFKKGQISLKETCILLDRSASFNPLVSNGLSHPYHESILFLGGIENDFFNFISFFDENH